jgi:hypothetical protein
MNTRAIVLKIPLFYLLLSAFSAVEGQQIKWPPHRFGRQTSYPPIQRGYIFLDAPPDTVKGLIRQADISTGNYLILDSATKTFGALDLSDIVAIRVFSGDTNDFYTDYFNIHYQSSLWRLWARKDGVAIYENTYPTAPGGRMVLVTPYRKIKMLHFVSFLVHNDNGLDDPLVRFIHKRYKEHVSVANFQSTKDICTYIVEQENKRINSGQVR